MFSSQPLKIFSRFAIAIAVTVVLVGCASGPKISTDYDRNADFSEFKTYGFFEPLGVEDARYSTIYGAIFRTAISQEMESRGYTKSANPDLMINVSGKLQDKTKVTTTSTPYMGGYYGYRRGAYGAWGGYGYGTETYVSNYTEGTVNVDLVDAAEKQMVWEGVAIGRVTGDKTNEEVRANINAAVAQMFADYPFRAGE